jgi:hypothetical protein
MWRQVSVLDELVVGFELFDRRLGVDGVPVGDGVEGEVEGVPSDLAPASATGTLERTGGSIRPLPGWQGRSRSGGRGAIGGGLRERAGCDVRGGGGVLHGPGVQTHSPQPRSGSGDADRDRASQLQHTIEGMDSDLNLGRPALVLVRAQPVSDHLFPARHRRLGASARVVARSLLPPHTPVLGNALEVAVALRRRALGRLARHRRGTRWHKRACKIVGWSRWAVSSAAGPPSSPWATDVARPHQCPTTLHALTQERRDKRRRTGFASARRHRCGADLGGRRRDGLAAPPLPCRSALVRRARQARAGERAACRRARPRPRPGARCRARSRRARRAPCGSRPPPSGARSCPPPAPRPSRSPRP